MKIREKKYLFEGIINIFAVFGFGIAVGAAVALNIGIHMGVIAGITQAQLTMECKYANYERLSN